MDHEKALAELHAWIAENQDEITEATLAGLSKLDRVVEMMTDEDLSKAERRKQFREAVEWTARAVITEHFGAEFRTRFSGESDKFRKSLADQAELAVRENPDMFADLLRDYVLETRDL